MYQWKETSESRSQKKLGGGKETIKTYNYNKVWSDTHINSANFKKKEGHQNPAMPFSGQSFSADNVKLGAFRLNSSQVSSINKWKAVQLDDSVLAKLKTTMPKIKKNAGGYYVGNDISMPQIGDMKISFDYVETPCEVSLYAAQSGDTFEAYTTQTGGTLMNLSVGRVTAERMFAAAEESNNMILWILRVVGFIVITIGFSLILRPLSVVADVVPFIGDIVEAGTGIIGFILSLVVSFTVIALAWLYYRPLIGVPLLVVAVAGVVFMFKKISAAKAAKAAA
jgi:hypothetical protein